MAAALPTPREAGRQDDVLPVLPNVLPAVATLVDHGERRDDVLPVLHVKLPAHPGPLLCGPPTAHGGEPVMQLLLLACPSDLPRPARFILDLEHELMLMLVLWGKCDIQVDMAMGSVLNDDDTALLFDAWRCQTWWICNV